MFFVLFKKTPIIFFDCFIMSEDERDDPFQTKYRRKQRIRAEFAEKSRYRDEASAALGWYLTSQCITATVLNLAAVFSISYFLAAWPLWAMTAPWVLGSYVLSSSLLRVGTPSSKRNLFVFYDRDHCLDNIYDRPKLSFSVSFRAGMTGLRNGLANASMSPIYWLKLAAYWLDRYDPEYHFK